MQRIAIANQKGGVGKTTTAVCLAGALRKKGRAVLLVDVDDQGSASEWLGVYDNGKGLLGAIIGGTGLLPLVHETPAGIDLIPCGADFYRFQSEAADVPGKEYLLRDAIGTLPADRWDYIIFDSPPNLGLATTSALAAADFLLVPVEAKYLSLKPLTRLFTLYSGVQKRLNPQLQLAGVLGCKVKANSAHPADVIRRLRQSFGDAVFQTVIRDNIHLGEAPGHKRTIDRYKRSIGAQDYEHFADELEGTLPATRLEPEHQEVANA